MKKRYLFGIGALIFGAILVLAIFILPQLNGKCENQGLGGKLFFDNQRMIDFLAENGFCAYTIRNENANSYPVKDEENYCGIGYIQAGSINSKAEMNTKFTGAPYNLKTGEFPSDCGTVKVVAEYIIGSTPMMMWLKDDAGNYTAFKNAGFITCNGDKCYIDAKHVSILVDATIKRLLWTQIGIDIPGTVNVGVPTGSGGRATTAMLLSCWQLSANGEYCGDMLTPEMIGTDFYHQAYNDLFSGGGQIPAGDDSVAVGKVWFPSESNATPTVVLFATESSYVSYYKGLSENAKKLLNEEIKVHGVYLERPVMTTFTVICLSTECKDMMDAIVDTDEFQSIMSEEFGIRSGLYNKAPTSVGSFIDPAPHFVPMVFPLPGTTSIVNSYYNGYGKP